VKLAKFTKLLAFMLPMLPGYLWKFPLTFLIGAVDIAILVLIPLSGAEIIDALGRGDWGSFHRNLLWLAALTLLRTVFSFTHLYVFSRIDERVGNMLRATALKAVLRKDLLFFEKHWVGDLVSRTINDTSAVKSFLTAVFLQMVYDGLSLAVVVVILIRMNPMLAALTILTAPVTLICGYAAHNRIESASRRVRENVAVLVGHLQSWLSRPFPLKAHNLEQQVERRFAAKNDRFMIDSIRLGLIGTIVGAINTTLLGVPSLLIFAYGGYLTFSQALSIGELFAFMTFAAYFNAPIQRLISTVTTTLPTLYPVYDRLGEILDDERAASGRRRKDAIDASEEVGEGIGERVGERVEALFVDGLRFEFGNDRGYSLIIPSFKARRGEIVGIAGPNGSGKTTLARLLVGLYRADEGEVRLGGEIWPGPVSNDRRKYFSFMPQDPVLFDGTLHENVTLFDPAPDTVRLAKIEAELNLADLVGAFPMGWETEVNAGSLMTFSGGQMQKLALARLLYQNLQINLLDEPTTGLDELSREVIKRAILNMRGEKIVIIISHLTDMLGLCDRVYELRSTASLSNVYECVERAATGIIGENPSHRVTHVPLS
jgi:ABC-type bacteriocin/lantibiotic exporter with double-glycine peptidase domain